MCISQRRGNRLREAGDTCLSFPDGKLQSWDLRLKPAQCDFLAAYQGQESLHSEDRRWMDGETSIANGPYLELEHHQTLPGQVAAARCHLAPLLLCQL